MKQAKTVWAVEHGEYSDYRVVGVFTSRANAKLVADKIDGASIDEWPLNPAVSELSKGYAQWYVLMLRDGTTERVGCEDEVSPYDLAGNVTIWRRSQAPFYRKTNTPDALQAKVWAKDAKHAIKIANEHRLRMIADNTWKVPNEG